MPTYEMHWDCPRCGSEKLLGKSHRHCPSCGSPQDPRERYFPPEDEKVAVEDHVFIGVDWSCMACDTANATATHFCVNCGAPHNDTKVKEVATLSTADAGKKAPEAPKPSMTAAPKSTGCWSVFVGCMLMVLLGIIVVIAVSVVAICFGARISSDTEVTVTGHRWERSLKVETRRERSDSGWCDSIPDKAYKITRSEKKKSTKKIKDGQDCKTVNRDNGDGTMSQSKKCTTRYKKIPVMAPFCRYKIQKWEVSDELTNKGNLAKKPTWPTYKFTRCKELNCTRAGKRTEVYTVDLIDADGSEHRCDFQETRWKSMAKGSKWNGSKSLLGNLQCGDLHQ